MSALNGEKFGTLMSKGSVKISFLVLFLAVMAFFAFNFILPVFGVTGTTANLPASQDSHVNQENPTTNYGTADEMDVESYHYHFYGAYYENERTLVQFDLSSIPSGSTITSARVYLYMYDAPGADRTYNIYKATSSWTESGVTWNNQPTIAASSTSSASTGTSDNVWKSWDVASDVQSFLSGTTNYGWELKDSSEDSSNDYRGRFYTKEYSGTTYDPYLAVTYYYCGDGTVNPGEVCDGNSQSCTINGYAGTQSCNAQCGWNDCTSAEYCGDGNVNGPEVCDDGANNGQPNYCNDQCTGTTTPVCGNGVMESGEQCESPFDACCDSLTCQFKPAQTVCGASQGQCDLEETCTGSNAACPVDAKSTELCRAVAGQCDVAEYCDGINNDCPIDIFQPAQTSCEDGFYCNGQETCDGFGNCQAGTTVSCNANDIFGIEACSNDPDNNPFTYDQRNPFTSVCDEINDMCASGDQTITHVCDKATCGAECDQNSDCATGLNENYCKYDGTCNIDPTSCSCNYASQYCPAAGTVDKQDNCYWGVQSCVDGQGCTLLVSPMGNNDFCDPNLGPTDTISPITTDDAPSGWQISDVTVTLTCSDAASGCDKTYYTTDGTDPTTSSPQGTTITLSGDGTYTIKYFSTDLAGNTEDIKTASNLVMIDATSPTATITSPSDNSYVKGTVTITADASDIVSGIERVEFWYASIGTKIGEDTTTPYSMDFDTTTATDGSHNLFVIAYDNAGNQISSDTIYVTVDNTLPVITIDNPNSNPAQSKTITASSNEGTLSMKVDAGIVCDDSLTFVPYESITFISESDNGKTVCYKAVDTAGNTAYSLSNAISGIDTTAPTTSDDYGTKDGVWQNTDQTITLTPADVTSGIASTNYCTDTTDACIPSIGYTTPVIIGTDGTTYFRYASTDNAGNVQITVTRKVMIDRNAQVNNSIVFTANSITTVTFGNVTLDIDSKTSQTAGISVNETNSAPNTSSVGIPALGKYAEITSPALAGNMNNVTIKFYYIDAEVSAAGIDESALRLYYYNATTSTWTAYDAPNGGVDTAANYVWATTDHFSMWGLFGSSVPSSTTTTTTIGTSGGGSFFPETTTTVPAESTSVPTTTIPATETTAPATTTVPAPATTAPTNPITGFVTFASSPIGISLILSAIVLTALSIVLYKKKAA